MSVYPHVLARDIRTQASERDRGYRHGCGRRRNSLGKTDRESLRYRMSID